MVRTIDLGHVPRPHGAAFVQAGTKLLVTSETSQRLLLVDFVSGRMDTALATNGRGSHMVTVQRDGRRAWTGNIMRRHRHRVRHRHAQRRAEPSPWRRRSRGDRRDAWRRAGLGGKQHRQDRDGVDGADAKAARHAQRLRHALPRRLVAHRTRRRRERPDLEPIWLFDTGTRRELAQIDLAGQKGVGTPSGGTSAGPEGITFDPIADSRT